MAYSGQLGEGMSILLLALSSVDTDRPTSLSMLPLAQTLLTAMPGTPPSRVHRTTVPCVENRFPDGEQFLALASRRVTLQMILLGAWKLKGVGPLTPNPRTRALPVLTCTVLLVIGLCMLQSMPLSPRDPLKAWWWFTGTLSLARGPVVLAVSAAVVRLLLAMSPEVLEPNRAADLLLCS